MSRRGTYLPSRRAIQMWLLVRVCVVEAFLIVALVVIETMHPNGIR